MKEYKKRNSMKPDNDDRWPSKTEQASQSLCLELEKPENENPLPTKTN